jgi:phosphate:Na+ symporter
MASRRPRRTRRCCSSWARRSRSCANPPRSLAVASAGAGLVDLTGACWLVYGANLGSGANYALLAKAHRGEAAQIAWMQVAQKLLGFAAIVAVMLYERLAGVAMIEDAARALAQTLAGQVAWVFLASQLAGSLLCTLLFPWLIPLFERLAPPSELQALAKPAFLIDDALVEPSFALELVGREERRLLERLPAMLDSVRADAEGPTT